MKYGLKTILLSLFCLSSCVELLQKPQSKITNETIVLNDQMLESMANAMYKDWWGNNYGFNCRMASLSLAGDDMITGDLSKPRNTLDDQMRVPVDNADVMNLWKAFYKAIFTANNLISQIKDNKDIDTEVADKYLGEAYFIRALMYFYVVRLWGDAPAVTDPQAAFDIDGKANMPRKPVRTIYDRIIVPDALEAERLLPATSRDAQGQAPTVWAAKMLLADVYLTMAGWPLKDGTCWEKAASKAKEVVQDSPHSLMPFYKDLWMKDKSRDKTEHIFAMYHSLSYLPSQYAISYLGVEENGWSDYAADPVFFSNFPADTRKEFCYTTRTVDTKGNVLNWPQFATKSPYIRKYRNLGGCASWGIEGENTTRSSLSEGLTPIYRYADALLIYAEASNKAEGTPSSLAYDCINHVRDRAFGDTSHRLFGLTPDQFNQAVFDEYGWENVFEFKRWFQLVRTEKVDEYISRNPDVGARVNVNKENYLFPVPSRQVELRKWTNNPGY